jgi:5-methylcytosine-specific restriction endonuclease McrA
MDNILSELQESIDQLFHIKPIFPPSVLECELQARVQLCLRIILLCIPSERLKEAEIVGYMRRVLNCEPSAALLAFAKKTQRTQRISTEVRVNLELSQNGRCALCGIPLLKSSEPHVDHTIPVVYGGKSEAENFQLLCGNCNLGKSSSLHWVMLQPFFTETCGEPTAKMRYAVLKRFNGNCGEKDCHNSSSISIIKPAHVIPIQEGGRTIFDNLIALCDRHHREQITRLQRKAADAIRRPATAKFTFQR